MGRKSIINEFIGKQTGGIIIKEKLNTINGRLFVRCECLTCKKMFDAKFHNVYKGNYKSCGCLRYALNYRSPRWRGVGEISQSFMSSIMRGAKGRNLEFNVSVEYLWDLFLKQDKKCAISGVNLRFQETRLDYDATASLDRIDATRGYVKGNLQWVHKDINYMKQSMNNKELLRWIDVIYKYNNE